MQVCQVLIQEPASGRPDAAATLLYLWPEQLPGLPLVPGPFVMLVATSMGQKLQTHLSLGAFGGWLLGCGIQASQVLLHL